jgi:hypothetical protein
VIDACHALPVTEAGSASTLTLTPVASLTVPCTTTGNAPMAAPAVGATIARSGAVRSTTTSTEAVPALPAASVALSVTSAGPSARSGAAHTNGPVPAGSPAAAQANGVATPPLVAVPARVTLEASVTAPATSTAVPAVTKPATGAVSATTGVVESPRT